MIQTFVDYCLSQIHSIPESILVGAFLSNRRYQNNEIGNLDSYIKLDVIYKKMLPELNIVGGKLVLIDLSKLSPSMVSGGYFYQVPLERTQGRQISRILSIAPWGEDEVMSYQSSKNPIESLMDQSVNATLGFHTDTTVRFDEVPPNCFVVKDTLPTGMWLKAYLEYDHTFSGIRRGTWHDFGELALLAAKVVIYEKLGTAIGNANFEGAQPNQAYLSYIQSCADAQVQFQTFCRENLSKLMVFADEAAYQDHINSIVGHFAL